VAAQAEMPKLAQQLAKPVLSVGSGLVIGCGTRPGGSAHQIALF
jgi:hypothetical protein